MPRPRLASRIVLFGLLILLGACRAPHQLAGPELVAPHPVPDIALQSADGPVSLRDFAGRYAFVYFGYTYCPDVCPLSLAELKKVREGLGARADRLAVVMISVDPARDTPERLAEYVGHFGEGFVGLTGDLEDIDRLAEPFGVYYQHREGTVETGYLVDHTSRMFLLDPQGNAIVAYAHQTPVEDMVADLEHLLDEGS